MHPFTGCPARCTFRVRHALCPRKHAPGGASVQARKGGRTWVPFPLPLFHHSAFVRAFMAPPRVVVVRHIPIELAQFLKFAGLTESGGEAKQAIANGTVLVNGMVETRKGRKLNFGDEVAYRNQTIVLRAS